MSARLPPLLLALLLAAPLAAEAAPLLSGVVRATVAEAIYAPPSNSWPVVLRYFVPEGTEVEPGDVLVRIDAGSSASQVEQLTAQIAQAEARAAKDVAELQVRAIDAAIAELDAELALDKARIDAQIPREHLSALDADRHRGEFERAEREHALKHAERVAADAAVERRRIDARLEIDKLETDLAWHRAQVANAEQRAETAGRVIYGFDNRRGQRFEEGASAFPGNEIGQVVGEGPMGVRAWALEPDRRALSAGQSVRLHFDAFPAVQARGRIERISGAPEPKSEWGDGRYFTLDITIEGDAPALKPGMSVRVDIGGDDA